MDLDGVLVQWGDRLFFPGGRMVRGRTPPLTIHTSLHAATIRARIDATAVRRVPQVMVKVTGGGRGMGAIAAHFRYISKVGSLAVEDDRGQIREGKERLRDLMEEWRLGGSQIDDASPRREALNIMLSMPSGTDALAVQRAAREFAQAELTNHRYAMVLHDHQANPHVHLSVRIESRSGKRLNPRKADLQRWRETFAEKLRGWGVEAEATRQATRGEIRNFPTLWRKKAGTAGRLKVTRPEAKKGGQAQVTRREALQAWREIFDALRRSNSSSDRELADRIGRFVLASPFAVQQHRVRQQVEAQRILPFGDKVPDVGLPSKVELVREGR